MCVNFPGLEKWLIDSEKDGVGYRVAVSKEKATQDNVAPLLMPFSDKEVFSITPVVAGAGRGTGAILAGVGLVALAIVAGPAAGGFLGLGAGLGGSGVGLIGATAAVAIGNVGLALVLGGIATAVTPA